MSDETNNTPAATPVVSVVPATVEPVPAPVAAVTEPSAPIVAPEPPTPIILPVVVAPQQSVVEQDVVKVATSLQDKIGNWLKDVYNTNKILFYTIIPLAGLAYLAIKYHNLLIDILLGSAKQVDQQAINKDDNLGKQADQTKSEADALVDVANKLPNQEQPVDENWNVKK